MTVDRETIDTAADAIRALNRRLHERDGDDYKASPEDLAEAVLGTIPDAIVEHATLYTLSLDLVNREEAIFSAPGGMTLHLHRGDWMERGRPARLWITAQHSLEPYAAV